MPGPVPSIGRSTVAPVVVKPEIDSNTASSNAGIQPVTTYGSAPTIASTTHASVTVTNTSRIRIWCGSVVNRQPIRPTTAGQDPDEQQDADVGAAAHRVDDARHGDPDTGDRKREER